MTQLLEIRIESPAFEAGTVLVAELKGRESISELFELDLRVVTRGQPLDEEKVLTSATTVILERKAADSGTVIESRRITGIVCELRDRLLTESEHREYVLKLVPRVWQAKLTSTSDVMMDLTVPQIIEKKLCEAAGLEPGKDLELRLKGKYEPREFVVQYKESNFDFASRLAEDLGIFSFFEEGPDGREVMVFSDDNSGFSPSVPERVQFFGRGERAGVYQLEARRQLVPQTFVARDYNYRNPSMDLLGEAKANTLGTGKVDEYGSHAKTPEEATFYAKVRAEEARARSFVFEGKSEGFGIRAGSTLTVEGHARGDLALVVTEVTHHVSQNIGGFGGATERPYESSFRALPEAVVYRPARRTPKPVVHGVVTGMVESAASTELGAIDDQGRYRVSFLYDSVSGRGDGKASRPLRMSQPSAGSTRGFHVPLTPGTEVLVTCLNGDPDRPIIAGAVPNPQTPSPVTAANAEKSIWTTNQSSIAIDDDQPRCKISVGGDHVFQIGEPNGPEQGTFQGTTRNSSSVTDGKMSTYSDVNGSVQNRLTQITGENVVNVAGLKTPFGHWKKFNEFVTKATGYVKEASALIGAPQKIATTMADNDQENAAKAHKKAKVEAAKALGLNTVTMTKQNDDGTTRTETADEALDRVMKDEIARVVPELPPDASDADKKAAKEAAEKRKAELKKVQGSATALADATKHASQLKEWWSKQTANVEQGPVGKAIAGIETAMAASGTVVKLLSSIADKIEAAAQLGHLGEMFVITSAAYETSLRSGGRHRLWMDDFKENYNIQASMHSAALAGQVHARVYGGKSVSMISLNEASVLGDKEVHVKSQQRVEIAANDCFVTCKNSFDVKSKETATIVVDKVISVTSENDDIKTKAKKHITFTCEENDFVVDAKSNFKVTVKKQDIDLTAEEGAILLNANAGAAGIISKQDLWLKSRDADVILAATKAGLKMSAGTDIRLGSKESVMVDGAQGIWLKGKSIVLAGKKVELG